MSLCDFVYNIIIIGDYNAGKTALINRYINGTST